jgi:LPS sulfotransferase NodH
MSKSPVFIVGSPRSGTSVLVSALRSVGYEGFNEGNFLPLITILGRAVDRHLELTGKTSPNVLATHVEPELLKGKIEEIIRDLANSLNVGNLWFDKSGNPDMIQAIPKLRRLWPNSVYIFAKRRAIENVISRVRKFPAHNFEQHCASWANNMAAWREVRAGLPLDVYFEVDQQDLIRDTEGLCERIADFLGLEPEQSKRLVKTFKLRRPQETSSGSAAKIYSLDSLGWSKEQLAAFQKHCVPEMEAFGYTDGTEYDRKA